MNLGTTELLMALTSFAPSFDDAALFTAGADHETGYVLQEHQRNPALIAVHDETRGLVSGIREDNATELHFCLSWS